TARCHPFCAAAKQFRIQFDGSRQKLGTMTGALEGVLILDFTQLVQGPFATQILGDLGAEIIKVEPPKGDWLRSFALDNHYISGESVSFLGFNRNKRSITVNLKSPDGVEIIKRLVGRVDIMIENFRPD